MKQRARRLSFYLLVASVLQIGSYVALSWSPEKLVAIFYFDPRIGLFFIESGIRGAELRTPGILQWLSAIWLLLIALLLLWGRPLVMTYVISEIIASAPSLIFFVLVVLANLSPAHGFSIGELFVPMVVMIVFTVVPLVMALLIVRKKAEVSSIPARAEQALGPDSP